MDSGGLFVERRVRIAPAFNSDNAGCNNLHTSFARLGEGRVLLEHVVERGGYPGGAVHRGHLLVIQHAVCVEEHLICVRLGDGLCRVNDVARCIVGHETAEGVNVNLGGDYLIS